MFFRGPSESKLRDALTASIVGAWSPVEAASGPKIAEALAHDLGASEVAIYALRADWWILLAAHATEFDAAANDDAGCPPRIRDRPELHLAHESPTPYPGALFVPLPVGDRLEHLLVVRKGPSTPKHAAALLDGVAPLCGRILEADRRLLETHAELDRRTRSASAQDTAVAAAVSVERLAEAILAQCARAVGYGGALVAEVRGEQVELRFSWSVPDTVHALPSLQGHLLEIDSFDGRAFVTVADADALAAQGIQAVLAVPIDDGPRHILVLVAADRPRAASEDDLATMEAYADQLGLVLQRESDFDRFATAYLETLRTTVAAIELSRPELRGHHARVTALADALAAEWGLDDEDRERIRVAASCHDVGLLGHADQGITAALEFQHPEVGQAMVSPLPDGPAIGRIIRQHHEAFDGFGFPDALSGDELSPAGQILALAEYVVERTTRSAIAAAESLPETAERIEAESGRRFGPPAAARARAHLRVLTETPMTGGGCVAAKGCPDDLNGRCPAARAETPCWTIPAAQRLCGRHGDGDCAGCYVYRTWGPSEGS